MFVLGESVTFTYTIPKNNENYDNDWDFIVEQPDKNIGYREVQDISYTPATSTEDGKIVKVIAFSKTGLYTVKLVRGTGDNYTLFSNLTFYVVEHRSEVDLTLNLS